MNWYDKNENILSSNGQLYGHTDRHLDYSTATLFKKESKTMNGYDWNDKVNISKTGELEKKYFLKLNW